ncbi:MAG: hypothetical protein LBT25_07015 [Candidatus Symbiothrix sp.]|jgi:hypothetical protein|nr:hypothetical protein [Candidatus Symbiothrix sp.]
MKHLLFIFSFALWAFNLPAQINPENSEWMQYLEELAESEDVDAGDLEQLFEDLSYLSEHPFDLQTVTKKD